jgi:hypothetical protein
MNRLLISGIAKVAKKIAPWNTRYIASISLVQCGAIAATKKIGALPIEGSLTNDHGGQPTHGFAPALLRLSPAARDRRWLFVFNSRFARRNQDHRSCVDKF